MENKYSNKYLIETSVGLQDVDKLENSSYFLSEANRYIKGEISLDELDNIINTYYVNRNEKDERNEEADKVAIRIAKIISEDSFTFSPGQLVAIHKELFFGLLDHPGELRTYNFTKREWILDGASVTYGDFRDLEATLYYDFEQEKKFSYKNLSIDEVIKHLSIFVSNLWQIHAFEEGNTRTTAVFLIKYLRSLGFSVTNDTFAKNSWYFRNALVRANYTNIVKGIYEDRSYLEKFLRNLFLNEKKILKNKDLHISFSKDNSIISKENRVLELIKNNPNIKSQEIADSLKISLRTVKNITKVLTESKTIQRANGKRYGYWKIL